MKRKEFPHHTHKHHHISNRHLAERYFYAGEHNTETSISLTQYMQRRYILGQSIPMNLPSKN